MTDDGDGARTLVKGLLSAASVLEDDGRDSLGFTSRVVGQLDHLDRTDGSDHEFLR